MLDDAVPLVDAELRDLAAAPTVNIKPRDSSGAGLAEPAGERAATQGGRRVGPYRLTELLGEGGMGMVYRARRDDSEYKQEVAVKILRHGLGSPQAIARFRDERQILAALEHPGIVRLLDGGRTDDGLPFLVLECVDGMSLTDYVREHELSVRARIELVLRICPALQYAHGKLVVHRDIKPGNVLVSASGDPKLLDFGVAKLLDPVADGERESRTGAGVALLTPEYASPEQVCGEPVSVATDVYSLGAVLYELLAGHPPHDPTGGPLELLRTICEVDPPPPSAIAGPGLRRELVGDLDNIVMKALHKEPARRYASVEQLADDLRRYLEGLPIAARTATFGYRAGKFVRRNRGKLAIVATVATALFAASVVSIRQARRADAAAQRANERFDEVRTLANSMLFEIDEAIRDQVGATRARELVVTRALTYLDRLAVAPDRDPALSRELAIAYMRIGDIQASPWAPNIGKPQDGLRSYQKASSLVAGLDPSDPGVAGARVTAAFRIGFMYYLNRDSENAHASLTAALAQARQLPRGAEVDPVMLARAYLALAYSEKEANRGAGSERYTADGLAFVERWDARSANARYWRATFLLSRADAAARAGDPDRAVTALQEIVEIHAGLEAENPGASKYAREHAYALLQLGVVTSGVGDSKLWFASTGDIGRAELAFRQGLAILERHAAADPRDADVKVLIAILRTSLGLVAAKRSPRDAVPEFREALASFEAIPATMRASSYGREHEYLLHCSLAHALASTGRTGDARDHAARGLELAAGRPFNVASCELLLAKMAHELGDIDGAVARLDSVARTLRPMVDTSDMTVLIGLVESLQLLARLRFADACAFHAELLARWRARPAATAYLRRGLAELTAAAERCTRP